MPRLASNNVRTLIARLREPIQSFVQFCNEQHYEGTLVVEQQVIEFHWTFGSASGVEKEKPLVANQLEEKFQALVDSFLALEKSS